MSTDIKHYDNFRHDIKVYLKNGKLHDAFDGMRSVASKLGKPALRDKIERLEERYFFMLRFIAQGHCDPEMENTCLNITDEAMTLVDEIYREAIASDAPQLYYSNVRYAGLRPDESISTLIVDYLTEQENLRLDTESLFDTSKRSNIERIARDIFNRIWAEFPLSADDVETLSNILCDRDIPSYDRELWVSALNLGLTEFFDNKRFELLARCYMSCEPRIAIAALCGILIGTHRFKNRIIDRRLVEIFKTLESVPSWHNDVIDTFLEIIRARDTMRLNKHLHDNIMPDIMRIGSDIIDKFKDSGIDISDPESLVENPEWENMLHSNDTFDKIKEMSELQMQGGDVFMSAFSNMRNMPFFNDTANWFFPYTPDHSSLSPLFDSEAAALAEAVKTIPVLCDSDKYSMLMAMANLPSNYRKDALAQLTQRYNGMGDSMSSEFFPLNDNDTDNCSRDNRRQIANNYIKNIYRFYKLFRRKSEFFDPFSHGISPIGISYLSGIYSDVEALSTTAEFLMNLGYYSEAEIIYKRMTELDPSLCLDQTILQKSGFCAEKGNRYSEAINFYETALIAAPDNLWILRHLAEVYRLNGDIKHAIEKYRNILVLQPDNQKVLKVLGTTLIEASEFADAIDIFHQIDYFEDGNSAKIKRALAWAMFMNKQYDDAKETYLKIFDMEPNDNDYLNYGHLLAVTGDLSGAIASYCHAADMIGSDALLKYLQADKDTLQKFTSLSESTFNALCDAVRYKDRLQTL